MQLNVDVKRKKEVTNLVIQETKRLKNLYIGIRFIRWISGCASIGYLGLNFILSDLNVVNVRGIPTKDYFSIISNMFLIIALGILLSIALSAVLRKLASIDINERVDEKLDIQNEILDYSFRIKYQSDLDTRIIIRIPLNEIKQLKYDNQIKKITFVGSVPCYYVKNASKNIMDDVNPKYLEDFVIFDYFSPSLITALQGFKNYD